MSCKNCLVTTLQFRIRFTNTMRDEMKNMLIEHLERLGYTMEPQEELFIISEDAMRELADFTIDFDEAKHILFAVEDDWQPLTNVQEVLEASWVDTIITKNAIVCYSQPIINAESSIFGHEVLARFIGENGELLFPLHVFEAAKLRGRLYALDRACRLAAVRYGKKLSGKIFINFIPTSIYAPEFCLRSTEMLARQLNIEPKRFIFEVVETEEVKDLNHLKKILTYYREKGFEYALDDVGEGFSTIDVLEEIQPNYMKLDRKFVDGVARDPQLQAMAKLFLAKSLEVGSVPLAEGIETKEDFHYLKALGFQLFQGYLFSKPLPEPVTTIDWQAISS